MKREQLVELGLNEELVEKVFKLHGLAINSEKDKYNTKIHELETQLNTAKTSNTDLETIQKQLDEFKLKYEESEQTLANERKQAKIKEALTEAKGNDLEYLMFKLGEVEDVEKLPELIDSLKEQLPQHFGVQEVAKQETNEPVEVVSPKLDETKPSKSFSIDEIANLSAEEINENWELVAEALQNN